MLPALVVTVHVLSVFWLVAGIIGRDVCYACARQAQEMGVLRTTVALGSVFDSQCVRPATFVVFVTGLLSGWLRGWPFLDFLKGTGPYWFPVAVLIFLSSIPLIVFVFLPRGRVYRVALDEASAKGEITPRLRAAMRDPVVEAARTYELVMVAVLAWLMIAKPF